MEKLSIEEKAKAYDEVREKIALRFGSNVAEEIFSVSEESEDEKIRKLLIDFFEDWRENRSHCWGIAVSKILAWLEKQGESYTKKDVDDAYLKGICDAKQELEKQGEQILANSAQTCKIENYQEEGWYISGDDEYICGISFDEPIKLPVEFYYKKKEAK